MKARFAKLLLILTVAGCAQASRPAPVIIGTAGSNNPWTDNISPAPAPASPINAPMPVNSPAVEAMGEIIVQPGDTLFAIARRHKASLRAMIGANSLSPPYHIRAGQRLRLPVAQAHRVGAAETLYSIAGRYGIEVSELVRINNIAPPYYVVAGQSLRLPVVLPAEQPRKLVLAAPLPVPAAKPAARPKAPAKAQAPLPRAGANFAWPARGKILSGYGPDKSGLHNNGINIAARPNASVLAAENGIVSYAGSELTGYGNLLLIRHDGGWITAYAHNSELLVQRGDHVSRGQVIARAGRTGGVAQDQVHFEIRQGAKAVNPVPLLAGG